VSILTIAYMEANKMKKQTGFTLVEIAIVMVIIGLLLGGVLKGQEMITNAKVKGIEADFNGVTAALYSYQDRYRALPGDDKKADRFGLNCSATPSECGDRNGKIGGDFNSGTDGDESRLFWLHLRNAGLVAGDTTTADGGQDQPLNKVGGIMGVSTGYTTVIIPSHFIGFTDIPQDIAQIIEAHGDNEKSDSGSILGTKNDGTTAAGDYKTDELYYLFFKL
jgi:prepilin-type N-terminal cleavage/methylation domain-containing protein